MARYNVMNRITHEQAFGVQADSAQEACARCGWLIGDCYVKRIGDMPRGDGAPRDDNAADKSAGRKP
ncbi:MAG: hypothetical protein H5T69_04160 [Chloroflexi bacterium]|nr:hypothetical protein [Chloroflexota bacterium]